MRRFTLLAIILVSSIVSIFGAPRMSTVENSRYTYKLLTPADGFPSSPTTLFVNDFGFAWAGSENGLYRIEPTGASIHKMPGIQPNAIIFDIMEDAEKNIWTLTDKGICGARPRDKFFEPDIIKGISDTIVAYAAAYTPSEMFFGGDNAIWKFNYLTGEFSFVSTINENEPAKVDAMFLGLRGRIVIFCNGYKDFYFLYPATGTIEKMDAQAIGWDGNYYAAFMDSEYKLWMASYNEGIIRFDSNGNPVSKYNTTNSPISGFLVTCFAETGGKVWIGTDGGGIDIIDLKSGEVTVLKQEPDDPRSLPANSISALTVSQDGDVWAGRTNGGIIVISESKINSFKTSDIRPFVTAEGIQSLYNDGITKNIWIGTNGSGLLSYNPDTDQFTGYPTTSAMSVNLMTDYNENTLLLYSKARGLFLFNKYSWKVTPADNLEQIQSFIQKGGNLTCLCNDAEGNILVAADSLYSVNPQTGLITFTARHDQGNIEAVFGSIGKYFHDETTLYRRDEGSDTGLSPLFTCGPEDRIHSASVGTQYDIWIVTEKGLSKYDIASDSISTIPISFSHTPHSVLCDGNGKIWIGTGSELYCYNQYEGTNVLLDESESVFGNDYRNTAKCINSAGDVFMGGVDGLIHLERDLSFNSNKDPEIVVLSVKLDSKTLSDFSNLTIPNNFNDLFVRFFVKDVDILRHKSCKFTIVGPGNTYEEEPALPQIAFHGLKAGKYSVIASCKTKDGRWTAPSEVFSFRVRSPWYLSWWFFLSIILAMTGLFWLISYTLRSRHQHVLENEANEERLNFLVNVSHELRTPLTLVMGPLGRILRDMPENDKYHDVLKKVYTQANRMKTLLNTVLTTSKIRAGASDMKRHNVPLNQWLEECVDAFREEASSRNMDIELQLDPAINMVYFDDNMCQIVLSNFMMNALKHNPDGRPLCVKSKKYESRSAIRVSVIDRGLGFGNIDPETLFARFYRADQDQSGFGIGLSYAKNIIEEHRGRIGAYNNSDGEGATFWFELPVESNAVENLVSDANGGRDGSDKIEGENVAAGRGIKSLRDINVLFVDDDKDLRVYFSEEFEGSFAKIICADNGLTAMDKIASEKVDLIISDVMMPELDGMELCRRIKQNPQTKDIPVILLTAKADAGSREMGMLSGADNYIAKPFDTDATLVVISKLFNLK